MQFLEEATRRKMSPKMLCAFKDGTKTMVEMTAMSNYTGLIEMLSEDMVQRQLLEQKVSKS